MLRTIPFTFGSCSRSVRSVSDVEPEVVAVPHPRLDERRVGAPSRPLAVRNCNTWVLSSGWIRPDELGALELAGRRSRRTPWIEGLT